MSRENKMSAKDKLIVALDVDDAAQGMKLFDELRDSVGMFKIGMQLFTAAGPDFVREIVSRGARVFLDLKYHDIPNTVAAAAIEATRLGVSIFNVHAAGGFEMMKRTADAVAEAAQKESLPRPKIIAVTLLTSADHETLSQIGLNGDPPSIVRRLALLADAAGLDGVVASAQEVRIIRETVPKTDFLIVTPGIRPAGSSAQDQRRVMSAGEAICAGADYLVVGRPVLTAPDRVEAARQIVAEVFEAMHSGSGDFTEQSQAQSVH
jgi:orotidine-5'-phosphate decarboxylase